MSGDLEVKGLPVEDEVDEVEALMEFIVDGLTTDGAHHKQWFLEVVLAAVSGHLSYDDLADWRHGDFNQSLKDLRAAYEDEDQIVWDDGIAP